jgi:DUF4097 and DUF4098 domain-containing protein YvlB
MHTFLTPDPVTLDIRNAAGEVRVVLTDTTSTTVDIVPVTSHPLGFLDDVLKSFGSGRGLARMRQFGLGGDEPSTADDLAAATRVEHRPADSGGTVEIDTDPARDGWRSSFTVTVTAPTGSSVRVKSQSGDVSTTGTAALADVRTASGTVTLGDVLGKALVQTASGGVRIAAVGGNADVRTASGSISVGQVGGDVIAQTTSGAIAIGAVTGNINARSVSGDVDLADAAAGQADVSAVSGDVRIGVHPGAIAAVNLTTLTGTTATDFEVSPEAPEGTSPVLRITVKTTSGDIRLRRAAATAA